MRWMFLTLVMGLSLPTFVNANVLGVHCAGMTLEPLSQYYVCEQELRWGNLRQVVWPLINGRKIF
jgi:hypothetical protein